jgi:hypothetical protein
MPREIHVHQPEAQCAGCGAFQIIRYFHPKWGRHCCEHIAQVSGFCE